jgi:hypothetical protein
MEDFVERLGLFSVKGEGIDSLPIRDLLTSYDAAF